MDKKALVEKERVLTLGVDKKALEEREKTLEVDKKALERDKRALEEKEKGGDYLEKLANILPPKLVVFTLFIIPFINRIDDMSLKWIFIMIILIGGSLIAFIWEAISINDKNDKLKQELGDKMFNEVKFNLTKANLIQCSLIAISFAVYFFVVMNVISFILKDTDAMTVCNLIIVFFWGAIIYEIGLKKKYIINKL